MSARKVAFLSLLAAVVAGLVVAFAPTGESCSPSDVAGAAGEACRNTTLIAKEGARILVVVAIPIGVALLPSLLRHRVVRVLAAILLWVCCVLGLFSIGIFFVPAAVLMTVAAARRDPAPAHVRP